MSLHVNWWWWWVCLAYDRTRSAKSLARDPPLHCSPPIIVWGEGMGTHSFPIEGTPKSKVRDRHCEGELRQWRSSDSQARACTFGSHHHQGSIRQLLTLPYAVL